MKNQKSNAIGPVVRLRIERKNNQWELVKMIRVPEMVIPSSDELPIPHRKTGRVSGFWAEAVNADGDTVFRSRLSNPFKITEAFSEDGTIRRLSSDNVNCSSDIFVPDRSEITEVRLFLEPSKCDEPWIEKEGYYPRFTPVAVFTFPTSLPNTAQQKEVNHGNC